MLDWIAVFWVHPFVYVIVKYKYYVANIEEKWKFKPLSGLS